MTSIHDFISVINELLAEVYPDTVTYIISGGDYIRDTILGFRQGEITMSYSPYILFSSSINYEDTIEKLLEQWKNKLKENDLC